MYCYYYYYYLITQLNVVFLHFVFWLVRNRLWRGVCVHCQMVHTNCVMMSDASQCGGLLWLLSLSLSIYAYLFGTVALKWQMVVVWIKCVCDVKNDTT